MFSRLRLRILTVNVIPLIVLMIGIMYLGQYEKGLIEAELKTLEHQARLYAGAIAETAVRPQAVPSFGEDPSAFELLDKLSVPISRRIVQRLGEMTEGRIRVYDLKDGQIADSDDLGGTGGVVRSTPLPPMQNDGLEHMPHVFMGWLADHMPSPLSIPYYPETDHKRSFPTILQVASGETVAKAWRVRGGGVILTAAAPIQNLRQIMGGVYITQDGSSIKAALRNVTINMLSIFGTTIAVTIILSFYLAAGIANPLKKLSRAAVQVRQGKVEAATIPDFSLRKDEIGDLSVALRDMTTALADRIDSIEKFAADVAHEIKNPLTSLRSAVETAAIVSTKRDRDRLFAIILHDVQRLDRLISDISNASRLDAELARETMGRVDMRDLLSYIKDHADVVLSRRAKGTGRTPQITLDVALPEDGKVAVHGIEGRLAQVFSNLVDNAISFSPDKASVRIAARRDGGVWVFTVVDEGPGIPENKLHAVFDRFYSERPSSENFGEHSGLGLSISKQIIEAHHGRIYAENIYNDQGQKSGARFTVILNAAE